MMGHAVVQHCISGSCVPCSKTNSRTTKFGLVCQQRTRLPLLHTLQVKRFQTLSTSDVQQETSGDSSEPQPAAVVAPRDDDVLPDSLTDALIQASQATWLAIQNGNMRCQVELLLAEFWDPLSGAVFAEEGDQMRFWKINRRFIESLIEASGGLRVKVIFPDMGSAALLQNEWGSNLFGYASLNDRRPVSADDDIIVLASPDPQGLEAVTQIADYLVADTQAVVMFNPRLASGDVGVGLNVRRLRDRFLSTFLTTYSLRPIGARGSVFRQYPDMWKVFVNDEQKEGRYKLVAERPRRPEGDALDLIIMEATGQLAEQEEGGGGGGGFFQQLGRTMASMQRFMRSLSG